jgi:hypothetical protein
VLDFDACKSIVQRGNGSYGLKPVIAVVPRIVAEIVGNVDPTMAGVAVSAQVNGNVMRATVPDANGAFTLAFLNPSAASSVNVVITAPNRATAVVSAVPIATQSSTRISTSAAPITLLTSTMHSAGGTVAPASANASVRALQAVGSVAQGEVAYTNANETGAYTLSLPAAAPLLAPYATPLPLVFTPQGTGGAYTLEASAVGYTTQTADVDVSTMDKTQNFTLVP